MRKEWWMMKDEGWRMKDEGWFQAVVGFDLWQTDERTNERTFAIVESLSRLKILYIFNFKTNTGTTKIETISWRISIMFQNILWIQYFEPTIWKSDTIPEYLMSGCEIHFSSEYSSSFQNILWISSWDQQWGIFSCWLAGAVACVPGVPVGTTCCVAAVAQC